MERRKLSEQEIRSRLSEIPGWEYMDGHLKKEFKFADFGEAFAFMARSALAAEKLDHHPDWSNTYNRVFVRLMTHDAGGITDFDFALAAKMG